MLKWADSETPKAANRSKQSKQCPWGQRHFYFNWLKNADSKGHFRLFHYHGLGSESKKTMNKPSLLFCLHNKFCLSHFLIKKKKSDALIVFIYTYPPKFSIFHSVTWLMVCIPIAWVLHHILILLWDSLEELSSCPLRAASVPSLAQSVVLTWC